jgi:hypothetical protein
MPVGEHLDGGDGGEDRDEEPRTRALDHQHGDAARQRDQRECAHAGEHFPRLADLGALPVEADEQADQQGHRQPLQPVSRTERRHGPTSRA